MIDKISSSALPPPNVTITSDGDMLLGSSLILTCKVDVNQIERLVVQPSIVWTKEASLNSTNENAVRINNTLSLNISSVKTSDAGQYTCIANISTYLTTNSSEDVILQSKLCLIKTINFVLFYA